MIKFLMGSELSSKPKLERTMFVDRAIQFRNRLKWDVSVNEKGEERDEYDELNPIYIILEDFDGKHAASLRLLPTTGKTMVNDHFSELTDGLKIQSSSIWECTRFCVSPVAHKKSALKLLAAGAYLMRRCSIEKFVGVFDSNMERLYQNIGIRPIVLNKHETTHGTVGIGLWDFDESQFRRLLSKAKLDRAELEWSFDSFRFPSSQTLTPVRRKISYMYSSSCSDTQPSAAQG